LPGVWEAAGHGQAEEENVPASPSTLETLNPTGQMRSCVLSKSSPFQLRAPKSAGHTSLVLSGADSLPHPATDSAQTCDPKTPDSTLDEQNAQDSNATGNHRRTQQLWPSGIPHLGTPEALNEFGIAYPAPTGLSEEEAQALCLCL
jgi:hypothetical protein